VRAHLFRSAAAADIEHAYVWYERERVGLGEEFLTEVFTTVQAVISRPQAFPTLYRQTRRALVRRFPYALFFRIVDGRIVFVACFHVRRNPTVWKRRQ
jgi:plasmid stabilization system protein ParE